MMNRNMKIARQLVKIAKSLGAFENVIEEGEEVDLYNYTGKINTNDIKGEVNNAKFSIDEISGFSFFKGEWLNGTVDGQASWYGGTWNNGIWEGNVWKNGTWKNGTWKSGFFEGGVWENGVFEEEGVFEGGTWKGGTWKGGDWMGGTWMGGYDKDGIFHSAGDSPDKWQK